LAVKWHWLHEFDVQLPQNFVARNWDYIPKWYRGGLFFALLII
jgi:hypothetical protein